jgi:drug/metabolite transporter (DMT)-like permease
LLLVAAGAVFTFEAVLLRHLGDRVSVAQVVFGRALAQVAIVLLLLRATGFGTALATDRWGLHLFRGVASLVCWWFYYESFATLDLSLATVLTFTTSLFVVVLAGPLLRERVSAFRWAAVGLGFAGVLVVLRPGLAPIDWGIAAGIGSALAGAAIVLANRALTQTERTVTIMFYIGVVTLLGTAPFALLDWRPLDAGTAAILAVMACCGGLGMWLTIEAYRAGEVSALAPIPFLRLVMAALAGWMVFRERPDLWVAAGSLFIVASGLVIARGEGRGGTGPT